MNDNVKQYHSALGIEIAALQKDVEAFALLAVVAELRGEEHAAELAKIGRRLVSDAHLAATAQMEEGDFDEAEYIRTNAEVSAVALNAAIRALVGDWDAFISGAVDKMQALGIKPA